jgi:hypothetical protein
MSLDVACQEHLAVENDLRRVGDVVALLEKKIGYLFYCTL